MRRVPAELALLALHQSGYDVGPGALRTWVWRGHITRGPGGYDLAEILAYVQRRAGQHEAPAPHSAGAPRSSR